MKKTALIISITSSILFASTGAELTQKHCASCHLMTIPTPEMIPTMKAPAMDAVGLHINLVMKKASDKKAFIIDYVQNPNASKSVCESNKVAGFGVMPSLKGKVSIPDLESISDHIIATYPQKDFVKMINEMKTNGKINGLQNSPFLINQSRLPHMTKVLVENWDKASLGLDDKQKAKLLIVRKNTITAIKQAKKQIMQIEADIIEAMVDRDNMKELDAKLAKLAQLKTQATKAHLKCISDTIDILTDEQLEFLFPFWDM